MKPRCRDCKWWRNPTAIYGRKRICTNETRGKSIRPGDYEIYHRTHCSYFMTPEGRIV